MLDSVQPAGIPEEEEEDLKQCELDRILQVVWSRSVHLK